jgi:hypothetical protein
MLWLLAPHPVGADPAALWRQLLDHDLGAVLSASPTAHSPVERLAVALAWMQREPRTEGNLERARVILRELAGGGSGPDQPDPALVAEFLLGRIAHLYRHPSDPATASRHYAAVIERGGNTPWAQHVGVRYIMTRLATAEDADVAQSRWREGELLVAGFTDADAIRDGHLALTHLGLYWGIDDQDILRHALAADHMTFHQIHNRNRLWISIANIAARQGQSELARTYYKKLIENAPRDGRLSLVKDRLAALEAEEAKP